MFDKSNWPGAKNPPWMTETKMIVPNQTNPLWEFDRWVKKGDNAQIKNPAEAQKQRCLNVLGKEIACVQDQANFRITPAIIGLVVVVALLVRR